MRAQAPLGVRVDRARLWLVKEMPFYGALSMRLADEYSEAPMVAATNGARIIWGALSEALSDAELRFVLAHETLHCGHQHFTRLPMTPKSNVACDHAINLLLLDTPQAKAGLLKMPKGGIADPQYTGLAEEDIYARLPDDAGEGYSDASGGYEPAAPQAGQSAAETRAAQAQAWRDAVIQATMAAKAAGAHVDQTLTRMIGDALTPRANWREEMADFARCAVSLRNDWSRPRRRSIGETIAPRRRSDDLGVVVFVRDTSGSIGGDMLAQFNAMIDAIAAQTQCRVVIYDADTCVRAEYELAPGEAVPDRAEGGGGTCFADALARAAARDEKISGLVYLSDLYGEFPSQAPDYPVLWISTGAKDAPFGRVVHVS